MRESLLTQLFQISHFRSMKNVLIDVLLVLCLQSFVVEHLISGKLVVLFLINYNHYI
jgi:hypothetical protein